MELMTAGVGEMAQHLRARIALVVDQGLTLSEWLKTVYKPRTLCKRSSWGADALSDQACTWYTYTHTGKTFIYIK